MPKEIYRVQLNSNQGRYGHLHDGLSISDLDQAKQDLRTLEGQHKAKERQYTNDRLVTDLAITGVNTLKSSQDPKAKELAMFLERTGFDDSSLHLAKKFINEHLSNDPIAIKALDLMSSADHVNSYGTTNGDTGEHSNYQRVQGHVDPFTGHKTFTHTTSKQGFEDTSVFAQQRNKDFDSLAQHFDIVEE